MPLSRRDLLRTSAAGAGALALGNVGALFAGPLSLAGAAGGAGLGYGPLRLDPDGLLDLPARFRYHVVSRVNDPLRRGGVVPDKFDGMGRFSSTDGREYLVRNHEQGTSGTPAAVAGPALTYDPGAAGGTTTLLVGPGGENLDEYVSLAGTAVNCAGGVTPWATWLTCEETEAKAGGVYQKDHGFVFEVDPVVTRNNKVPQPLTAMGRFAHEAVAIDPTTSTAYLTEDAGNPNGLVYRFVPKDKRKRYGSYRAGGTLTAMLCRKDGQVVTDLGAFTAPGTILDVQWVPVADPLAAAVSTRKQFQWSGDPTNVGGPVTRSRKLEGMWWGNGRAFIVASYARLSDGSTGEHDGQVWSYHPPTSTLRLEVRLARSADPEGTTAGKPDGPDNITVNPNGGLILCEDGEGRQHLLTISSNGKVTPLARNARDDSEFAGACFSSTGRTLYVNLQSPGVTLAVTGPFQNPH